MRAVAGFVNVEYRDDQPGLVGSRPTRRGLDVFGRGLRLAEDAISPSLGMSRPTEIMFVAIAQSTRSSVAERCLEPTARVGSCGWNPGGEFNDLREVFRSWNRPPCSLTLLRCSVALQGVLNLLLEDAPRPPSSRRLLK